MVYEKVIFLINANKQIDEKEKVMQQVLPIIEPHIQKLTIQQTSSEEELKVACQSLHNYELLILYGGDGTLHLVINELAKMDQPPKLAILPGGTCNDFSRVLSIPQNLKKAAQTIIRQDIQTIDIASINKQYYLNFSGVGLIAKTSENIDEQLKESFGKLSYFISALQQFQQSDSLNFEVKIDGEVLEEKAVMVLVMNGYYVGTHQFPLPSISVQDGLLDVIFVKDSNLQTIRDWFSLSYIHDDQNKEGQIKHIQGKNIQIKTKAPKDVDTDGEVYLKTPIDINVIPKKLSIIVGEGFVGEE